ncbi:hypothetical protein CAQU_02365 [Corynebacterium aquilae DSM 44791]|uniref:Polysaccharide biosynthesis protein C-terminal domain-containing protein n=2 Tax=Corynebacterium aquilae TaxID=203263 RepID=A0A1L7CE42_9CORY|nr:hypothetical protein CAQU_02365 [Corynebacterium aquilae DSM 44791]
MLPTRTTNGVAQPEHQSRFDHPAMGWAAVWLGVLAACGLWRVALGEEGGGPAATWPRIVGGMAAASLVFALLWVIGRAASPGAALARVAANLAPTALLMSVFPLIAGEFSASMLGATPALVVVLAVSVSVPWVCGIVAAPFYPALSEVSRAEPTAFAAAFMRVWPPLVLWSAVPVVFFTTVCTVLIGWDGRAAAFFAAGLATNVLLAQALIVIQELRMVGTQVAAWAAYAAALYAAPQLWWLAPLAGVVVCLWRVRASLGAVRSVVVLNSKQVLPHMRDGALASSVLWLDKFLLIALLWDRVDVYTVYVALIPMVVAQSLYFGRLYDSFHTYTQRLSRLVATCPAAELNTKVRATCRRIEYVVLVPVALGVLGAVGIVGLAPVLGLKMAGALGFVVAAPLAFLCLSLACFQLNQLGGGDDTRLLCAAHGAATVLALVFLPLAGAYVALIVIDGVLATIAIARVRRRVCSAAFELFWKEAVAW